MNLPIEFFRHREKETVSVYLLHGFFSSKKYKNFSTLVLNISRLREAKNCFIFRLYFINT